MLVEQSNFKETVEKLKRYDELSLDTETTGLMPYHGDRLFSLIIGAIDCEYYFNFKEYPGLDPKWVLPRTLLRGLSDLFRKPGITWYLHNAKFDLAILAQEDLEIRTTVHCTQALARLENNAYLKYSLEECGKRIGLTKDASVDAYIKKHRLYSIEVIPGKKKRVTKPHFDEVPFEIITPYGCQDAHITLRLGQSQKKSFSFSEQDEFQKFCPKVMPLVRNEQDLTKTCLAMERAGIKIDRDYCERAADFETCRYQQAATEFEQMSKVPFIDSNQTLALAFTRLGEKFPKTEKGNPSFTDDVLEKFTSPVAMKVREYRDAYKKANTYYRSYLFYADSLDCVHANIRQGGTTTGRFSYSDPNLQNIPKEEDTSQEFLVKRAFIPREDFFFVSLDYKQMEYYMMLDYAGEIELIEQIKAGMDVHEATQKRVGTRTRQIAKTLNFAVLYGAGAEKIAWMLGISVLEAKQLRASYFAALPRVKRFIYDVINAATYRKWIFNWAGRRYQYPDPNFAYAAPNHLIQGGCADVVKFAMNKIQREFGVRDKSRMLVQVHDELLFEIHKDEIECMPKIKAIMESIYPAKHLPMQVSVAHSFKSWGDLVEGMPNAA